jgi:DUF4097 and DUF4098 domain-containing protein YvlB
MQLHTFGAVTFSLALGVAGGTQGCQIDVGGANRGEVVRVEKRFAVTGVPDLTLTTFDGSIEVRSWDGSDVQVEIEKRGTDRADIEAIEIVSHQSGNRLTVEARRPPGSRAVVQFGISPSARLVASVPRRCNLLARSGDGTVVVERLAGRVDLATEDGTVRVSDLEGTLRLRTGDGTVRVVDLIGPADIETGDGSVSLSGRLTSLRLRTGDGGIMVRAERGSAMADAWELRTHDGSVTVELPEGFAANLDADAGGGRVTVDRELAAGDDEGRRRRSLRTALNGGGKLLTVRTGDGTIFIKRL